MDHGDDADHLAHTALARLNLADCVSPHMAGVAYGLRVRVDTRVIGEALGWCDPWARRAHVAPQRDPRLTLKRLSHELGHQVAYDAKDPNASNDELADAIGMRLAVPARGVRRVVREVGLCPARILAHYPLVVPSCVFQRVAECTDTIALVHGADGREVSACRYRQVETDLVSERWLVGRVRATGLPVSAMGESVMAWPFRDVGGVRGVVILADLWGLADWLERAG